MSRGLASAKSRRGRLRAFMAVAMPVSLIGTVTAGVAVLLLGPAGAASAGTSGPVVGWSPVTSAGTFQYGTVKPGTTASQTFTLKNTGGTATGALTVALTGSAAFAKTADTCTAVSLGRAKSCSVTVAYSPSASGQADKATLTATSTKPAATASLSLLGAATKASPAIATVPGPGGPAGATVTDTAALSGGSSPTGSVEFRLYGPAATADCSGTAVDDETVPVSGDGSYTTPSGAAPTRPGTYWWAASYSGDAANNPAVTACGDESVTITKASPAIATVPGPGGPAGGTVTDTAALSGGSAPTGSVEFRLYGPAATADCSGTPVDDETVPVSGDGSYATPAGAAPTAAGTYWWTTAYSGDAANNPAVTACGDQSVTITAASIATLAISPGSATIDAGATQAYTATGFDSYGNPLGDVTAATTFTIAPDGNCTGAVCTAATPGDHTVTGTDNGVTDTSALTVTGIADLAVHETVSTTSPAYYTGVSFTTTVTNNSTTVTATGVTVAVPLPLGLVGLAVTPSGSTTYDQATGTWTIGNLAPAATATLTIGGLAGDVSLGTQTVTATVTATTADPKPADNTDSASESSQPAPLSVVITPSPSNPLPPLSSGVTLTWTGTAVNADNPKAPAPAGTFTWNCEDLAIVNPGPCSFSTPYGPTEYLQGPTATLDTVGWSLDMYMLAVDFVPSDPNYQSQQVSAYVTFNLGL